MRRVQHRVAAGSISAADNRSFSHLSDDFLRDEEEWVGNPLQRFGQRGLVVRIKEGLFEGCHVREIGFGYVTIREMLFFPCALDDVEIGLEDAWHRYVFFLMGGRPPLEKFRVVGSRW